MTDADHPRRSPAQTRRRTSPHDPHEHVRLDFTVAERDDRLAEIEREKVLRDPGFGKTFTDHMVKAVWTLGEGWHDAEVSRYGPLSSTPPPPSCTTRRRSSRA